MRPSPHAPQVNRAGIKSTPLPRRLHVTLAARIRHIAPTSAPSATLASASACTGVAAAATPPPPRLLRPRVVCERTGLSRSTLWRLERRGDFPVHRQISTNAVG